MSSTLRAASRHTGGSGATADPQQQQRAQLSAALSQQSGVSPRSLLQLQEQEEQAQQRRQEQQRQHDQHQLQQRYGAAGYTDEQRRARAIGLSWAALRSLRERAVAIDPVLECFLSFFDVWELLNAASVSKQWREAAQHAPSWPTHR